MLTIYKKISQHLGIYKKILLYFKKILPYLPNNIAVLYYNVFIRPFFRTI